ncbi:MAG: hypothetical protein GY796_24145 [Chloroflexi bacterium]|nr:hypothetical protein [Chloroflexota bacterium]
MQLQHNGNVVNRFPTRYVEELLGFLLLNPHVEHSRLKLIDLLWPDCAEKQGRGRLNTTLWRLRTLFDTLDVSHDTLLHTTRGWVSFKPDSLMQADFELFEKCAQKAQFENDFDEREHLLHQAVAEYQGDFCEGIYTDWCLIERERLARLHLRLLGQLMHCLLQRGEYEAAAEMGQHILQMDPLREEVHRAVMLCYKNLGWHTKAIKQFQICSDLLALELRVVPMPETAVLFNQVISERTRHVQTDLLTHDPLQDELQAAFVQFQSASDRLNKLLARYKSS